MIPSLDRLSVVMAKATLPHPRMMATPLLLSAEDSPRLQAALMDRIEADPGPAPCV